MRTKSLPPVHDRTLFAELIRRARSFEPAIRSGAMFGCPAAFVGRRMAFCVYGTELGAKVPEKVAQSMLAQGLAEPFQPYGKVRMREWIKIINPLESEMTREVLERALIYARTLAASR